MFRELYYTLFYLPDLRNINGLMRFGERCINALLGHAMRRSASARRRSLHLEVQRESTEAYLKNVQRERLLEDSEFFSIRKKVQTGTLYIAGIFVTECLLSYYSTLVLITGTDLDVAFLRWLLAIALTLGAITASERLLEACLPQRHRQEGRPVLLSPPIILLWSVLLLMVLLGVIAVAEARVRDIEGGKTGSIVYYGFVALSTALPLIGGAIAWEISRFYDAYKETRKYRNALRRLDWLTRQVDRNAQQENDSYADMLTTYWNRYNNFRSFKENYDLKHGTNPADVLPLCYDFEEFKRISAMRYRPLRLQQGQVVQEVDASRFFHFSQEPSPGTRGDEANEPPKQIEASFTEEPSSMIMASDEKAAAPKKSAMRARRAHVIAKPRPKPKPKPKRGRKKK
jgi:hypothetical protein